MYRRCFTQLRRLVNFARMREHGASPSATIHRLSLWSAICRAPFEGSFSKWWARNLTDPANCQFPQNVPSQSIAKQLASDFESFVNRLEQDLITARRAAAQKRRQTDANQVFRDIRAPGPEPISSLAPCREAKVTSIEAADSFCFEPRCAFDAQMQLSHAQGQCSLVEYVRMAKPGSLVPCRRSGEWFTSTVFWAPCRRCMVSLSPHGPSGGTNMMQWPQISGIELMQSFPSSLVLSRRAALSSRLTCSVRSLGLGSLEVR